MEKSNDLIGQILSHGPSQGTLSLVLRKMQQEGRHSEVIQECLKGLDRYPDDIRLRILLAESYLEVGSLGQAEEELEKALSMIEGLISSYKLKARICIREKRSEEAAHALRLYLAHKPKDQEALDLLTQVGPVLGDTDDVPEKPPEREAASEKEDREILDLLEQVGPVLGDTDEVSEKPPEREVLAEKEDQEVLDLLEQVRPAKDAANEVPDDPTERKTSEEKGDQEALDLLEQFGPTQQDTDKIPDEPPEEKAFAEKGDQEIVPSEIATPTLAEIYYNQGQIDETIATYERVLLDNPNDKASALRLSELKGFINEEEGPQPENIDPLRSRKERMIEILERWRAKVQESSHGKQDTPF